MKRIVLLAVAVATLSACCENNKPKFDAKEYAERKTERLDKIVELTDAQEKEVYSIYLAQGKEIKKNIKAAKNECGDVKHPDCKKAECKKAECDKVKCDKKAKCDKAECNKPECKKAECDKAKCDKKAECAKAKCDKAECDKPECKKAECDKAECKKTECKKAECKKAECDKAECDKAECKKAECDKAKCNKAECKKAECKPQHKHHPRPHFVTPEMRKATLEQIKALLTPEQCDKLKEHRAKRHNCCPDSKQCMPTPACTPAAK